MKEFIRNYKLQVFAASILALSQVSALTGTGYTIERNIANSELANSTEVRGGQVIEISPTASGEDANLGAGGLTESNITDERFDQIQNALDVYFDKSKACLVKLDYDNEMKSLLRAYERTDSNANLIAISQQLEEMELLRRQSFTNNNSNRRLNIGSSRSSSSSRAILDDDNSKDLKEIAKCHEKRIKELDSNSEKRAYFKELESKFADMLAESDSKEVAELAQQFIQTANNADPNNALGFQTIANMHSEYAMIMANSVAQIKMLEQQLALDPNNQLLRSQLQLAKTNLDTTLMQTQNKYMAQISPQAGNAAEQMTAVQQVSTHWKDQIQRSMGGQSLVSFGNSTNSLGLTTSPVIPGVTDLTNPITGVSTLPSIDSNLMTLPAPTAVQPQNLTILNDVRQNFGNRSNIDPSLLNPNNRQITRQVPTLGTPN